MHKEKPLWERIYQDQCCWEVIKAIGYEGCVFRELQERLKPLIERFGEQKVESATLHMLFYDGQVLRHAKPLTEVKLRSEVRKPAWGVLGPPPEHPWYEAFKSGERLPLPWDKPEVKPEETPKKKWPKKAKKAKK